MSFAYRHYRATRAPVSRRPCLPLESRPPMNGFLHHLGLTLKLNFRNPQAVVFGYVVPIFFLFAYGSVFAGRSSAAPLTRQLGQLITISVLGGACFGMPIAFV